MLWLLQLLGFGSSLLDGIDPNPENFVMAGIVHTREAQIGCLLRLEPNKQAQVGRSLGRWSARAAPAVRLRSVYM